MKSIPGGVDGVVIVTRPEITELIVKDCVEAGVKMVWMHQSLIKKYHGQWLKEMGDRILGSFKVNSDAVYCAGEFVKACYHENITIRRN